jgi:hypothetical protein
MNTAKVETIMIAAENESPAARAKNGKPASLGAAHCLNLAAAPIFAVMALGTGLLGGDPANMNCSGTSPLNSMAVMYVMMSAIHLAPWLKLIANCRAAISLRGPTSFTAGVKR